MLFALWWFFLRSLKPENIHSAFSLYAILFPCYTFFFKLFLPLQAVELCFISPSEELPIFSTSFHLLRQMLPSSLSPGLAKSCNLDQLEQGIPLVIVISLGISLQKNSSHCKVLSRLTTYCCERSLIFCQTRILEDVDLVLWEAIFPVHRT